MTETILILAANPKNVPLLRLEQEVREIADGLQRAQKRDKFILRQVLAARPVDVRRAMLDCKPSIVHFCGHGAGEEGIVFEDQDGQAKLISTAALTGFFELFADKVKCVVLNACYTEAQAMAIARHIPHVIGMKRDFGDAASIEFAVAFYDAIGAGESVEFAYKFACSAIQWAGTPEHLTPILIKDRVTASTSLALEHQDSLFPESQCFEEFATVAQGSNSGVICWARIVGDRDGELFGFAKGYSAQIAVRFLILVQNTSSTPVKVTAGKCILLLKNGKSLNASDIEKWPDDILGDFQPDDIDGIDIIRLEPMIIEVAGIDHSRDRLNSILLKESSFCVLSVSFPVASSEVGRAFEELGEIIDLCSEIIIPVISLQSKEEIKVVLKKLF